MPMYETIAVVAEKHSVILDIGTAYTKVGFARELGPRFIIPTEVNHPQTGKVVRIWNYQTKDDLYIVLKEFIHRLYFKYLAVNPKDRRVVIVESVLCPTVFRNTLAEVLFMHFEIPSLVYVPSHLMALFTLGISSALVMDVGYSETIVLPIYCGVPILNTYESLPVGGQLIHRRIEAELMEKAYVKTSAPFERPLAEVLSEPLKESVLEDIKVRTCFITRRARGLILQAHESRKRIKGTVSPDPELEVPTPPPDVEYPLDGEKILTIPGTLREWAAELLFEQDADNKSIATLILDSLLRCPIDTRKELANNVIIMGGTAMLPGFKHSLLTEIKMLLDDPRYSSKLPLKEIKIHNPPAKENYVAWLGAAAFGATEAVPSRSITKDQYRQKKYIPDWCDKQWAENGEKCL
ncbi:actin-related protein 10-like [Argiope bruennichi]|uniref:Actin-related protein 10 like protein n=1 Tax=Argiope bruennichi TaxID=94029 RepID=A0A8T0F7H0_ARGBR|nr:actin-related protein 10-like [Argiope bruennichi]KAF8786801.1 Actin-related protein 10 like protein [Argiope bruennichi]